MNQEEFKSKAKTVKLKADIFIRNSWYKCENEARKVITWAKENPTEAAAISGALVYFCKKVDKYLENKASERKVWDPHYGHYIPTKRALRYDEKVEFRQRCANGEDPRDVLIRMGLYRR